MFAIGFCAASVGVGIIGWKIASVASQGDGAPLMSPTLSVVMSSCGSGKRINCVVDGDIVWLKGEEIRLEGFNAP